MNVAWFFHEEFGFTGGTNSFAYAQLTRFEALWLRIPNKPFVFQNAVPIFEFSLDLSNGLIEPVRTAVRLEPDGLVRKSEPNRLKKVPISSR